MSKLSKREFQLIVLLMVVGFFVIIFNFIFKPLQSTISDSKDLLEAKQMEKLSMDNTIASVETLKAAIETFEGELNEKEASYYDENVQTNWWLDKNLLELVNKNNAVVNSIQFSTDPTTTSTQSLADEKDRLVLTTMVVNISGEQSKLTSILNELKDNNNYILTSFSLDDDNDEYTLTLNISVKELSQNYIPTSEYIESQLENLK
jgi:hypothetical protein